MRKNNKMMFGILALLVSIVAIGFVYAGFTQTLNINGTGNVVASRWSIYFANLSNASLTGTANLVTPATIKTSTSIGDYEVVFATPGDSLTYIFDVVNDGDYDAVLTGRIKGTPECSPSATLCNYLSYTLKYTSNNRDVAENDTLLRNTVKNMTLKLILDSNMPASALSDTDISISNLGITLLYSQASGYNGANSTAVEPSTNVQFFTYEINGDRAATYAVSDQDACESYLENNLSYSESDSQTLCNGGSIGEPSRPITIQGLILREIISSSDYETAGLSNVNITIENGYVTINGYKSVTATYTVSDQEACVSYFMNSDKIDQEAAQTLCSTGKASYRGCSRCATVNISISDEIAQERIPSSDYETAGLSNVNVIAAPTDVIIPSTIEGYPVTTIGENAFTGKGLTSFVLPASIISIPCYYCDEECYGDPCYRGAFDGNQLTSVIIQGKSSSNEFTAYQPEWRWASNLTCVADNTSNVENGCITWEGSN